MSAEQDLEILRGLARMELGVSEEGTVDVTVRIRDLEARLASAEAAKELLTEYGRLTLAKLEAAEAALKTAHVDWLADRNQLVDEQKALEAAFKTARKALESIGDHWDPQTNVGEIVHRTLDSLRQGARQ